MDLLKDSKEGTSYIIEINGNGGQGIIKATGVNHWEFLIDYCEMSTGKKGKRSASFLRPGTKVTDPSKLRELLRLANRDTIECRIIEEVSNNRRVLIENLTKIAY